MCSVKGNEIPFGYSEGFQILRLQSCLFFFLLDFILSESGAQESTQEESSDLCGEFFVCSLNIDVL